MHRVSPVLKANEDRISFVISLTKDDAFGEDRTRTLKYCKDHENVIAWEMARHQAWREMGVFKWITEESDPMVLQPEDYAQMLDESAERIKRAARIIRNEEDDALSWIKYKDAELKGLNDKEQ